MSHLCGLKHAIQIFILKFRYNLNYNIVMDIQIYISKPNILTVS